MEAMIATVLSMVTSEEDEPTASVAQPSPFKERLAERRKERAAQEARLWDPKRTRTRNVVRREGAGAGAGAGAVAGSTGVEEEYETVDDYTRDCHNYLNNEVYFTVITYEVKDLFQGDTGMYNNLAALLEYVTRENNIHVTTTLESWPSEYIVALAHMIKFIKIDFNFNELERDNSDDKYYVTGDYLELFGIPATEPNDFGEGIALTEKKTGHCYQIGFDKGKPLSTREEFAREFLLPKNSYDFTIESKITEC